MEDQTYTDFMIMKRKRKYPSASRSKTTRNLQPDSTTSMSSFIQNALLNTASSHETPEHPRSISSSVMQHAQSSSGNSSGSRKKTQVESGSKKHSANISAKKSMSGVRKKLKLVDVASRNWDMMMMMEKWPDYKDSVLSHSDESNIDSYSDAEEYGSQHEDEEIDSDDIQDQTNASPQPVAHLHSSVSHGSTCDSRTGAGKKREHIRRVKKLQTSTPLYHHHQEHESTSEIITDDDFDSRSSDSDHGLVDKSHSLHDFISSTTKVFKGVLPRPVFNENDDSSDSLDIASSPSSPDEPSIVPSMDQNRTKTSDWVKQLHMESTESNQSHDTLNETMKTPCDSAKKTTRGRKLVVGGLAEQLQRLVKRESSEITFWEHKAKKLDNKDTDLPTCLTVHILSLVNCYSLFIATCKVLRGTTNPQTPNALSTTMMEHSPMTDISEPSSAQNKKATLSSVSQYPNTLCTSSTVPMSDSEGYCDFAGANESGACNSSSGDGGGKPLEYGDVNGTVIVFFSQRSAKYLGLCVGSHVRIHPPWQCLHLPTLSQDVILCTHFCQLVGHTHVPTDTTPTSPIPCKQKGVTGIYSLLSPEKSPLQVYPMLRRSPVKGLIPTRLFTNDPTITGKSILGHGSTMVMENRTVNVSLYDSNPNHQTTGTTHVNVSRCLGLGALEYVYDGVLSAVNVRVLRAYRRKITSGINAGPPEEKWALLLCDATQTFAELLVLERNSSSKWNDLIREGQNKAVMFTNLKFTRKTSATRNPELLSLIRSLKEKLSMSSSTDNYYKGTTITQWTNLDPPTSCYVLRTQCDSEILECSDGNCDSNVGKTTAERVSLLARVVYTHIEVPPLPNELHSAGVLPVSTTYQCGYYMFVVSSTVHHDSSQLLRVYLKTGFPVSGLEKVLVTPSTDVLLRDVRCQTLDDGDIYYSMDACSLLIPMSCQDSELVYPTTPPFVTTEQLSALSQLSTPHFPSLTSTTATPYTLVSITDGCIVGVDEENAYSWPICDTCGSEKLGSEEDSTSELYCEVCQRVVMSPAYQMELSVYISTNKLTVLVQLLQSTIHQLLPVSTTNINLGFDVHCILNKDISLKSCYILGMRDTERGDNLLALEEVDVAFPLQVHTPPKQDHQKN